MNTIRRLGVLTCTLALAACGEQEVPVAPAEPESPQLTFGQHGIDALISGTGHHTRTIGATTALTVFAFHGWRERDGETHGFYYYDFRAAGFSVSGPITCISIAGNQAWVGGTVARIDSPDPADQELVGVEMWWRSIDLRSGFHGPADSTTGLGFAFPGSTITAESWCNDQPAVLIMRQTEKGNLLIKGD